MAQEYAKVLIALRIPFIVVGRSEERCEEFRNKYSTVDVYSGGIEFFFDTHKDIFFSEAIVAVTVLELKNCTEYLIKNGIKKILLEKPAGLNYNEIQELNNCSKLYNADVCVAYNRRFYSSVLTAKSLIEKEGGITSFFFEFTEWGYKIASLPIPENVKQNWFLANSSHVVDLAFHIGGYPKELSSYIAGSLSWHSKASRFAGAGVCENDVLFSYCANWNAPGRWGVEVLTNENRYIFRPMEKLSKISKGSVLVEEVEIDDSLDTEFKPGLFLQTKAFLENDFSRFCTLQEQKENIEKYYLKMCGYLSNG